MQDERAREMYDGLVREHARGLFAFAYRLSGDAGAAEDLVQETYVQAWRSIRSLHDVAAGRAWLVTILRRRWSRSTRDAARRPGLEPAGDAIDDETSSLPGPDVALFERSGDVQRALDRVDPRLREAFLLVFLEGLTCAEAAERLGVPLGTVLSRVHRARVALRERLRGSGGGMGRRSATGGGA